MPERLWVFSSLFFFGIPGLVGGIVLGRWLKSWKATIALVAVGVVASVAIGAAIPDDPDDDDIGLALVIGTVANLAAWTIGLIATAVARRR